MFWKKKKKTMKRYIIFSGYDVRCSHCKRREHVNPTSGNALYTDDCFFFFLYNKIVR